MVQCHSYERVMKESGTISVLELGGSVVLFLTIPMVTT